MRFYVTTLVFLAACGGDGSTESSVPQRDKPLVCTTNYPLQYCVKRIVGDLATVERIVPGGEISTRWRPDRQAIARLQSADLIVLNGASAEEWAFQASLPMSRVVETARAFEERFISRESAVTHSHGGGETHTHAVTDPHTWADPRLLHEQSLPVVEALLRRLPKHEPALRKNLGALTADLEGLASRLGELKSVAAGTTLAGSDAVYGYLARFNGWNVLDLDMDPKVPPSDQKLAQARDALEGKRVSLLLWETAPDPAVRDLVKRELSLESVVFPVYATVPEVGEPDYLAEMGANIERLSRAFQD